MTAEGAPATSNDGGRTNFMVWPNDTVEERVGDDDFLMSAPGLYRRMTAAGFPKTGGNEDRWTDDVLDFTVGPAGDITAYAQSPAREHAIPVDAARVFLDWYATVDSDEESAP